MKQRFSKRTRLVSALLTLAMVFTFLPFSAFAATDSYGPVYITDANVPDKTFREYLLKQFDKDGNGVLTPAERYAVTEIDVNDKNITSLKGIEFFPNLKINRIWNISTFHYMLPAPVSMSALNLFNGPLGFH